MQNFEVANFPDADSLASAAADLWLKEVAAANRAGKPHTVALSGGRIANNLFSAIVTRAKGQDVAMEDVHFFWADERCVPPDDADSNYKTAHELLLAPLNISPGCIHRIRGEDSPEVAAEKAAREMSKWVKLNPEGQPVLDLIFLGIGPDGHTASLFPGEPEVVRAGKAIYRAVRNSPKPPPNRVTLGYPAIAAAAKVWMLVSGEDKEQVLAESLRPEGKTPFARVLKSRKSTKILINIPSGSII